MSEFIHNLAILKITKAFTKNLSQNNFLEILTRVHHSWESYPITIYRYIGHTKILHVIFLWLPRFPCMILIWYTRIHYAHFVFYTPIKSLYSSLSFNRSTSYDILLPYMVIKRFLYGPHMLLLRVEGNCRTLDNEISCF